MSTENDNKLYEIRRFYKESNNYDIVKRYLTLEQAQKHCNDPKTRKDGVYFDGYTEMSEESINIGFFICDCGNTIDYSDLDSELTCSDCGAIVNKEQNKYLSY